MMRDGDNRIRGHHVIIHNRLFAECEVLDNFRGLEVQEQRQGLEVQEKGLGNWSSKILDGKDFPQGQQHWVLYESA